MVCLATPARVAMPSIVTPAKPFSTSSPSANLALEFVERGVDTVVVRFAPTVHGDGDPGFMSGLVAAARAQGVSAYIGDGTNRWAAVHRGDAGRLVRLALDEKAPPAASCTPPPRPASRPATSPGPSGAGPACPSPPSRPTGPVRTSAG